MYMYVCICSMTIVIMKKLSVRAVAAVSAHRVTLPLALLISSGRAASAAQRIRILKCLAAGAAAREASARGLFPRGARRSARILLQLLRQRLRHVLRCLGEVCD